MRFVAYEKSFASEKVAAGAAREMTIANAKERAIVAGREMNMGALDRVFAPSASASLEISFKASLSRNFQADQAAPAACFMCSSNELFPFHCHESATGLFCFHPKPHRGFGNSPLVIPFSFHQKRLALHEMRGLRCGLSNRSIDGMHDYKVKFEVFEGPLDLLLYLIKKEEEIGRAHV